MQLFRLENSHDKNIFIFINIFWGESYNDSYPTTEYGVLVDLSSCGPVHWNLTTLQNVEFFHVKPGVT
jgi:hypothetical protein